MRSLYDSLRRRRDRGRQLVRVRRECSRLTVDLADRDLDIQRLTAQLVDRERDIERLSAEIARARTANDQAAEEIVRLSLAYEGARLQLEARDIICDELESEVERLRAARPGREGIPA